MGYWIDGDFKGYERYYLDFNESTFHQSIRTNQHYIESIQSHCIQMYINMYPFITRETPLKIN